MIRIKLIPVLMTIALLTACGSKDEKATPDVPAAGTPPAPAQLQPLPSNGTNTIPDASSTALNPAHGQPGHRCDISVGAPLNSPAAQPAPVQQTMPQQPVQVQAPTLNTTTPSKGVINGALNPAHGQPGHRCDIAVGAPLNSKPTN